MIHMIYVIIKLNQINFNILLLTSNWVMIAQDTLFTTLTSNTGLIVHNFHNDCELVMWEY